MVVLLYCSIARAQAPLGQCGTLWLWNVLHTHVPLLPSSVIYSVGQKWHPFGVEFPVLLDALYLQFSFTHVSFSLDDVVLFCRCEQVVVGLTNDEPGWAEPVRSVRLDQLFGKIIKFCQNP